MRGRKPESITTSTGTVATVPSPPSWMGKDAKAEWRRVAPLLVERKVLTEADLGTLESYCVATGTVREAQRILTVEGLVVQTERGPRRHPAQSVQSNAMEAARRLAGELGLTPTSRSRPAIRDDSDDDSLLD